MKSAFSRRRRLAIAAIALGAATVLFRPQVAASLVVRGDDLLYRSQRSAALAHYARALALDPGSAIAADRYAFVSMESHTHAAVQSCIRVTSAYLSANAADATILTDRAMCNLVQRRYALARRDFVAAARQSGDARSYVFAGWCAKRLGDDNGARVLWRRALLVVPQYLPALTALGQKIR